jgi:hypothetical protein
MQSEKETKLSKKILLAAASFILTLLALEIYLRIFPDNDIQANNDHQYIKKIGKSVFQEPFHSMKDLYPLQFDNRHYYQRSQGFIYYNFDQFGSRWLQSKTRDTTGYNVFVLGDSFTLGYGLRYEDSYVYRLQEQLRKQQSKRWICLFLSTRR